PMTTAGQSYDDAVGRGILGCHQVGQERLHELESRPAVLLRVHILNELRVARVRDLEEVECGVRHGRPQMLARRARGAAAVLNAQAAAPALASIDFLRTKARTKAPASEFSSTRCAKP